MLKKLKKGLKKAAKAAVPIGAAILAAKAMGGRKQKPLVRNYFGGNTTGDANIAENIANFNRGQSKIATRGTVDEKDYDIYGNRIMAKGGRAGHKKGGRVGVGKAKRGFGRALKRRK